MSYQESTQKKKRNYIPLIIIISVVVNGLVIVLSGLPAYEGDIPFDVHILPMMNAIFNSFTFIFLVIALIAIMKKNVTLHRRFIYAAFTTTALFLVTYVTYHFLSASTSHGGSGFMAGLYYFILITHIVLAAVIVPLVLITVTRAWNMEYAKHRKIARWTMPLWLYVSLTGVLVYVLISPYY
ncbi:DUF420 domain-containing protein [Bacillaceae bacterium SIJ1]|uniref:DUF420 domain-containing protein n=1 Tax=Litoribacterium kuwaitense TaxID=1398745 RepID=UPI0013EC5DE6|nr:DUF420 domain-containing protein [Litoribacterium kuwaitense]NGP46799.1 DUF420 domain-containing protein [Litoribacterium kuwaitense]